MSRSFRSNSDRQGFQKDRKNIERVKDMKKARKKRTNYDVDSTESKFIEANT